MFILYRHFRLDLRHNIPIISTSYSHLPSLARLYYILLHIITGLIYAIYVCVYNIYIYIHTVERLRGSETTVSSTPQHPEFPYRSPTTTIIHDKWNTDCWCEITRYLTTEVWQQRSIYVYLYSFSIIITIITVIIIIIIYCHERL